MVEVGRNKVSASGQLIVKILNLLLTLNNEDIQDVSVINFKYSSSILNEVCGLIGNVNNNVGHLNDDVSDNSEVIFNQ